MKCRNVFLVLLLVFTTTILYAQTLDSTGKTKNLLRIYTGGRPKYSKASLKLYSDSTYEFSNWYHFGRTENDTGIYLLTDSTLSLYSTGFTDSKQNKTNSKTTIFKGQLYRIQKEKLLLFTKKEENRDKASFYRLYFTLHRVK